MWLGLLLLVAAAGAAGVVAAGAAGVARTARAAGAATEGSEQGGTAVDDFVIGVVEAEPERAALLAAGVRAGAGAAGAGVAAAEGEPGERLSAARAACGLAEAGVLAAAAGSAEAAAAAARAGLTLLLTDERGAESGRGSGALPLFPGARTLAAGGAALARDKGWRRAVLLHDGRPARAALLAPDDAELRLTARALPPPAGPESDALLRNLLLVLKKSGADKFVVWCSAACTERVLTAARRVGLLAERHAWLLLAPDLHTRALDSLSHGGADVSALRLFDPAAPAVRRLAAHAAVRQDSLRLERDVFRAPPTALVLAAEAARWAARAWAELALPAGGRAGSCSSGRAALHADTLLNYLRSEEWGGAAGAAAWGATGARRAGALQVAQLARGGSLVGAGSWAPGAGVTWTRRSVPPPPRDPHDMENRTFTFYIAMNKPYIMMKESADRLTGNAAYEGFCIELIEKLSEILKFNYTLVEHPGPYGSLNKETGEWNGMIHTIMTDEGWTSFAITDLTITSDREKAVDFTTPFMNLGISILFRKPTAPKPKMFAFMLPFSNDVWLCLGVAYLGTSLVLYVVGRVCPEEWQNPYPCVEEPEALENQFTLANALWFNLGAMLLQGSEIAPVAYGSRAVASVWWVFALVITSSYTANLATLLAKKTSNDLISNVRDLANNDLGITYGAMSGGSTFTFFEKSQNQLYHEMYLKMKDQKMPATNPKGIEKVMKDNYAFLMESTTIEYIVERNCEVKMVGNLLDNKGYGIAMKKESPYRQSLNLALLRLQEAGALRDMKDLWWREKHGGGACNVEEEHSSEGLDMSNFEGLFLVLVVGSALGLAGACAELAVRAARTEGGGGYWRRLWAELRFVFRGRSVKPRNAEDLLSEPSASPSASASPPPGAGAGAGGDSPLSGDTGAAPGDAGDAGEADGAGGHTRSCSLRSRRLSRRRSSMAAASARLARHRLDSNH